MRPAQSDVIWKPNSLWLRKGQAVLELPDSDRKEPFKWSFHALPVKLMPISFVECRMSGFGISASGFGDGLLLKGAMIRAFAEAFERLWMLSLSDQLQDLIGTHGITSSNGFAAGATANTAISHSKGELIERALLLEAWQSMRGWKKYFLRSIIAKSLCATVEIYGWTVKAFILEDKQLGSALVALAQHKKLGATLDAKWLETREELRATEIKLMRSILKAISQRSENTPLSHDFPVDGTPLDQARFYQHPYNSCEAFAFLTQLESQQGDLSLSNSNKIRSKLIIGPSLFPAVAVSAHPEWKPLSWGKQSIGGRNPWPHPLA